jgi:hypothetical protein
MSITSPDEPDGEIEVTKPSIAVRLEAQNVRQEFKSLTSLRIIQGFRADPVSLEDLMKRAENNTRVIYA